MLTRDGAVVRDGARHGVRVEKVLSFDPRKSEIDVEYTLTNLESKPIALRFGVEWVVGLQAGDAGDRYYYDSRGRLAEPALRSMGELPATSYVGLRDEWNGVEVKIEVGTPAVFWRFPLETVSLSEEGFERVFQGSVVVPHWKVDLEKEWRCTMKHHINALKRKGTS
jgi:alpha-amylase